MSKSKHILPTYSQTTLRHIYLFIFNKFFAVYFLSNLAIYFLIVGSPVWKPRDMISLGDAQSTTRKDDGK